MRMTRLRIVVLLAGILFVAGLMTACGGGDGSGGNSGLGESCTKTDDCKSGLKCIDLKCVAEQLDGDTTDGDTTDGDTTDGDTTDGDIADGDTTDGDTTDGDTTDGDIADGDGYSCNPQTSFACHDGDVYWKDCHGDWSAQKEECDSCACSGNACVADTQYSSACDDGDVYWYDCHGTRQAKKEECDSCACSENACVADTQYSLACDDDDVYWYDCHGGRAAKKDECGSGGCCISDKSCMDSEFPCCDGACADPATGFEWQETPTLAMLTWNSAVTYCADLNLDGTGWRLPNINELRSLIRNCGPIETGGDCGVKDVDDSSACLVGSCWTNAECNPSSCADNGGPTGCYWPSQLSGTCSWYWSSSPIEDVDYHAWGVSFDNGYMNYDYNGNNFYVRCVR